MKHYQDNIMDNTRVEELLRSLVNPKRKTTAFGFAVKLFAMSTILLGFVTAFVFTAKLLYWILLW